jgi:hypothetical protein
VIDGDLLDPESLEGEMAVPVRDWFGGVVLAFGLGQREPVPLEQEFRERNLLGIRSLLLDGSLDGDRHPEGNRPLATLNVASSLLPLVE